MQIKIKHSKRKSDKKYNFKLGRAITNFTQKTYAKKRVSGKAVEGITALSTAV